MHSAAPNPLLELRKLGESAWLDDISRGMLEDGSLKCLIDEDGIAGLTSNPAIFANSIMTDPRYAQPIAQLLPRRQLRHGPVRGAGAARPARGRRAAAPAL